jgi:hypothetical protein
MKENLRDLRGNNRRSNFTLQESQKEEKEKLEQKNKFQIYHNQSAANQT